MRHFEYGVYSNTKSFNPRICKRCDVWTITVIVKDKVSIHASVKDATRKRSKSAGRKQVSIHASVKDATENICSFIYIACVSIHASVKDATQSPLRLVDLQFCFNPRICKRCDLAVEKLLRLILFQSTHL